MKLSIDLTQKVLYVLINSKLEIEMSTARQRYCELLMLTKVLCYGAAKYAGTQHIRRRNTSKLTKCEARCSTT